MQDTIPNEKEIKIHCAFNQLVSIHELKPHPKNRNNHPEKQIVRLAQIIEYQGFRHPIKVSMLSGYITSGHGRLEPAKLLGIEKVPVDYQEYENEEQEYADLVADNAISLWAEIDFAAINHDLSELGPDFDLDCLGLENFTLDPFEKEPSVQIEQEKKQKFTMIECPHCKETFEKAQAQITEITQGAELGL